MHTNKVHLTFPLHFKNCHYRYQKYWLDDLILKKKYRNFKKLDGFDPDFQSNHSYRLGN